MRGLMLVVALSACGCASGRLVPDRPTSAVQTGVSRAKAAPRSQAAAAPFRRRRAAPTTWDTDASAVTSPAPARRPYDGQSLRSVLQLAAPAAWGVLTFGARDGRDLVGEIGQLLPSAFALIDEGRRSDSCQRRFLGSLATTLAVTRGLKELTAKRRPDASDKHSFPSGHTSMAFAGAAWLSMRRGPSWGAPAYAIALATSYSRLESGRHYLDDVLGGMAVAHATTWLFCPRAAPTPPQDIDGTCGYRMHLTFAMGAAWQDENEVETEQGDDNELDLGAFDGAMDLLPTSRVSATYALSGRGELFAAVDAIDLRGSRTLTQPLQIATSTFAPGETLYARWLDTTARVGYRHRISPASDPHDVRIGAALLLSDRLVELEQGAIRERVGGLRLLPIPCVHIRRSLGKQWEAYISAEGIPFAPRVGLDVVAGLLWQATSVLDVGASYRWSQRDVRDGIDNDPVTQGLFLTVGRRF